VLCWWVEVHDAGQIKCDPFQMKTGPGLPGRAPDILFVAKRNLSRLKRLYLDGPADLVIEIISEGSRAVDRGEKYYEYEKGGIREYWLLDPLRKQAEFYRLGRDRLYHAVPIGEDGRFESAVLKGLWLNVEWLWRKPLPSVLVVQKAWKLP
jgi:Uma2 family endonuclease